MTTSQPVASKLLANECRRSWMEFPGFRGHPKNGLRKQPEGHQVSKKSTPWSARRVYEFMKAHSRTYDVKTMCRALGVTRSGYYAWLQHPISNKAEEDARLLRLIRASFKASHGIYGSPRVFLDLREAGETCSKHRVARLMRVNKDQSSARL